MALVLGRGDVGHVLEDRPGERIARLAVRAVAVALLERLQQLGAQLVGYASFSE
jgi:hypothetical protein